jgi:hypothetical protein
VCTVEGLRTRSLSLLARVGEPGRGCFTSDLRTRRRRLLPFRSSGSSEGLGGGGGLNVRGSGGGRRRGETVRLRLRATSKEVGFRRSINSVLGTLFDAEGRMGAPGSKIWRSCLRSLALGVIIGGKSSANDGTPDEGDDEAVWCPPT